MRMGQGLRVKDWLRVRGASPVSYRHNFLVIFYRGKTSL